MVLVAVRTEVVWVLIVTCYSLPRFAVVGTTINWCVLIINDLTTVVADVLVYC